MDVHEVDRDGRNQTQNEEVCHLYAETREERERDIFFIFFFKETYP